MATRIDRHYIGAIALTRVGAIRLTSVGAIALTIVGAMATPVGARRILVDASWILVGAMATPSVPGGSFSVRRWQFVQRWSPSGR
jgi:hypothetical protein